MFAAGAAAACTAAPPADVAAPVPAGVVQQPRDAGVNRSDHRDKPHLILISFDAFRPEYLDRFELSNFRRVLARGTRAKAMITVFPSLTFPAHYSLVTGLHPERHGIVGNSFYDPRLGRAYSFRDAETVTDGTWYRGEPIWATAESQGMVAACFFWPGSEAAIGGVRPTFWNTYDASVPNEARVATVVEWLRLPDERRPHVVTLYFSDVDGASHRGPLNAPAIERAAQAVDRALGLLLDGIDALPIRDRVYVLLTSDHGMAETSAAQTIGLSSLVDPSRVRVGFSGAVTSLHVASGGTDAARRLRDDLNARVNHGRAYLREELPERFHYRADPRAGDVIVVMDESWTLATMPPLMGLIRSRWGDHGWDPALPSMHAIFAIAGPGIRSGATIPPVEIVDVYPLMTELLGLRAAAGIDGRSGRLRGQISIFDPGGESGRGARNGDTQLNTVKLSVPISRGRMAP